MPEPPAGEADLRELALRFMRAEGYVLAMLAEAAAGDRRWAAKQALETLAAELPPDVSCYAFNNFFA